jgi:hypothetical protein
MLDHMHNVMGNMDQLKKHYDFVEGKSRALQEACEQLHQEQASSICFVVISYLLNFGYFNDL